MIIVAGVGNLLRHDDGFGPAVIAHLREQPMPDGVRLIDAGVRTLHLAYELAEGVDLFVLVDLVAADEPPGTVVIMEPDFADASAMPQGHGAGLDEVWALCRQLGPGPRRTRLVGCQPRTVDDGMGLSDEVAAAVGPASDAVLRCVREVSAG